MKRHQKYKELGLYLKKKREENNLTQDEVKRHMDYTSNQIVSNWERGLCPPPKKSLKKLSKIYNIPPTEMIDVFLNASRTELISIIMPEKIRKKA